ncbi:MAG: hypothetical protein R8N24_04640 [Alphaproteobacteria bacterium]|nr:hypothetical protein [Alphaproteobacteria bacterium]
MTDIERAYAQTFSGRSGEIVLQHLRKITIERVLGPNASDSELRSIEAQRALVQQISAMILRGKGE